jgi:hypothetical protein
MLQDLFDELPSMPYPEPPQVDNVAGWAWLIILLSVLAFELWALKTDHLTLSQWAQRRSWLRLAGTAGLTFLIYHLFWSH